MCRRSRGPRHLQSPLLRLDAFGPEAADYVVGFGGTDIEAYETLQPLRDTKFFGGGAAVFLYARGVCRARGFIITPQHMGQSYIEMRLAVRAVLKYCLVFFNSLSKTIGHNQYPAELDAGWYSGEVKLQRVAIGLHGLVPCFAIVKAITDIFK